MKHFICNLSILCLLFTTPNFAQSLPPEAVTSKDATDAGAVFSGAYAPVQKQGALYYIDTNGAYAFDAITQQFNAVTGVDSTGNYIEDSKQVFYVVEKKHKRGITTEQGRWLVPAIYDEVNVSDRRFFVCQLNEAYTWYDTSGTRMVPEKFADMGYLDGNYFDVKENSQWGIYSKKEDRLIIPCTYQQFDYCDGCGHAGNYVMAKKNNKWGVIDFAGNVLVPFAYDHQHMNMRSDEWVLSFTRNDQQVIVNVTNGKEFAINDLDVNTILANGFLAWTNPMKKAGLVSPSGKQVLPTIYQAIQDADPNLTVSDIPYVAIQKNNLHGLADTGGVIIIPPFSTTSLRLYDTATIVGAVNSQYSFYNLQGKRTTDKSFSEVEWMRQPQVLKVKKNGKYGIYHPATKAYSGIVYDDVDVFGGYDNPLPYIRVTKNGKYGLLSLIGKTIIPPVYDDINILNADKGVFEVQKGEFSGVYDSTGKKRIPLTYIYLRNDMESGTGCIKASRYDKNDHLVSSWYHLATDSFYIKDALSIAAISQQKLLVQQADSSYQLMDAATFQLTPIPWRITDIITDNTRFLKVKQQWEDGWQLLEMATGNILPESFSSIEACSNGMLRVVNADNKYGYLHSNGQTALPCQYNDISLFSPAGVAVVKQQHDMHDLYGFVDTTGKAITPIIYHFDPSYNVEDYMPGNYLLLVKNDNDVWMGLAAPTGKELLPVAYNNIWIDTAQHRFLVNQGRKFGIADSNGRMLTPVVHDDIYPTYMNRFGRDTKFTWPLLVRDKEEYYYIKQDGTRLPVTVSRLLSDVEYK